MFGGNELNHEDLRRRLSDCLLLPIPQIPEGVVEEMDEDGDGLVSASDVQVWINTNVDWCSGQQALDKCKRSPTLFGNERVHFAVFGFDYA